MNRLPTIFLFCLLSLAAIAQDSSSVIHRIILIGDAGEMNASQQVIIPTAATLVIPSKTTTVYLGDNIYPRGMGLPNSAEESATKDILRSQFTPMRSAGASVYFIPGNHDWDKMGKDGLAKIRAQSQFIEQQQDPLLHFVPKNGCPDPVEITLTDSLVIIAWDSEWWLFPHQRLSEDVECECSTEAEVIARMEELAYKNRFKTVVVAGHHPFLTYGIHGGFYSLKNHLFPLTEINKKLYIPLPIVGSLYPLLRRTVFLNPEDTPHPTYQKMIKQVKHVFEANPNTIYAAGHDHGLQLNKSPELLQIISGSGAKDSYIKPGEYNLFSNPHQGFVVLDYLANHTKKITFYTVQDTTIHPRYTYTVAHKELPHDTWSTSSSTESDSTIAVANASFNTRGNFHRKLFGENYRQEWATPTKVPVIKISEFAGGLRPLQRGGGMQSISLRLADSTGKQWVIRSVNKRSEALLPASLHQTLAQDFLDDATSAQHPYSALVVPSLANALKIPHAKPIIGIIAPDTALGIYHDLFANTLCLVEEREPLGKSDNTFKMLRKLQADQDDTFKAKSFLRARVLDVLIGDWDRHEDQWRWYDEQQHKKGADKDYLAIPRDRDQVMRITEGLFPHIASMPFLLPTMQGFGDEINSIKYSMLKSNFLHAHVKSQWTEEEFMSIVEDAVTALTDSVLAHSLTALPKEVYMLRHVELYEALKKRRDALPTELLKYYQFTQRIVDIRLSDKHEHLRITDAPNGGLHLKVQKINKDGLLTKELLDRTYDPSLTKEVRVYLSNGNDSVSINAPNSRIKLRIIGGNNSKKYHLQQTNKRTTLYDKGEQSRFYEEKPTTRRYFSQDSTHTAFIPVNLYNVWAPKVAVGYNLDDGILLGAGFKYTHQRGFRKEPFNHVQELVIAGSFASGAIRANYQGYWKSVINKADVIAKAAIYLPNTQNFFGIGNESEFHKKDFPLRYYRARYNFFDLSGGLAWQSSNGQNKFQVGPRAQIYYMDPELNNRRFIQSNSDLHTYDSLFIHKEKVHGGFFVNFEKDNRNRKLMPSRGGYFKSELSGMVGANKFAKSFAQWTAEMAVYLPIANESIVLANRTGGGITVGSTAFYQALYLGGHSNLRGYRQFRFAGEEMLYNNLELRIKIAQIGNYILPGQFGALGFYDAGKVWARGYNSNTIHQGFGGGLYYAPAGLTMVQAVIGRSQEGWHPYVSVGFRF